VALLLFGLLPPSVPLMIVLGFVAGTGLGVVMPVNQVVVQTVAGRERLSAATATVALARSTGGAAGAALFGALVFSMMPHVQRGDIVQNAAAVDVELVVSAFHRGFLCVAAVAALAAFTARRMPRVHLWQPAKKR
jgi:MFS family permease